jgi:hypothetical protein
MGKEVTPAMASSAAAGPSGGAGRGAGPAPAGRGKRKKVCVCVCVCVCMQGADEDMDALDPSVLRYTHTHAHTHTQGEDDIDPLDPSYYSDAPRGNWNAGLAYGGKTGLAADSTASGPLFQQRPLPSPGAILKARAGKDSKVIGGRIKKL